MSKRSMVKALRRHGFRTMKRVLGERGGQRLRERGFRALQRVRGLPLLKTTLCLPLPDGRLLLAGALVDPDGRIERVELHRRGAAAIDVTGALHRFADAAPSLYRTLVAPGAPTRFAALLDAPDEGSQEAAGTPRALVLRLRGGRRIRSPLPPRTGGGDALAAIRAVLATVPMNSPDKRRLFDTVYGPAVESLWTGRRHDDGAVDIVEHNASLAPAEPLVTLVIPIYGRHDFIEHQIAQFVDDPDMRRHEILFVIDDPRLDGEVRASAASLARLYPIAFRILHLSRNLGYAGANNRGVAHARGRHVLLLNSDILPKARGWLGEMVEAAGERLAHSLVGARLLYEDESVQHDGMRFFASPFLHALWTNVHPGKGLPASVLPSRAGLSPRECLTGACLLMTRENYERLGGFDERFVLGDFEDSDLCLRARRAGLDIVLAERVVLYHLERQSQSLVSTDRWKEELTYYNCWRHTMAWHDDIVRLQAEHAHG